MGSGYVMNSAVLRALQNLTLDEQKQTLEALGINYLIDTFGYNTHEDFETHSRKGAELVKEALTRQFKREFGETYPFSVDVRQQANGNFKVSFFK